MRLLVTGTDTDVGKTVVTAWLAAAVRATGRSVAAVKPIASGVPAGSWGEDAEIIAAAAGHAPLTHDRLLAPISPHRAAAEEGCVLDPRAIRSWLDAIAADVVLVEGAGGWRVPFAITPRFELRHLAQAGAPVVIVAPDRLGVLNHTLLTVEAVRGDGFVPAAVVLNRGVGAAADPARAGNLADLQALLDVPVVALPRLDPRQALAPEAARAVLSALGVVR